MSIRPSAKYLVILGFGAFLGLAGCGSSSDKAAAPKAPSTAETKRDILARAETGDAQAQFLVGFDMCCGDGDESGRRNIPKATTWLCRAAHQGEPRAQFHLGRIYADGRDDMSMSAKLMRGLGLRSNSRARLRLAAMWYDLAMAGGHAQAAENRLVLNKSMKLEDQVAVEKMRTQWRQIPCQWNTVYDGGTAAR